MDIKSIQPTAKFVADLENGQRIELNVKYASIAIDGPDYVMNIGKNRFSTMVRGMLINAVEGWDITENGQPLKCEGQKKIDTLNVLFGVPLAKKDGEETTKVLGIALFDFVQDQSNFLKN